MPSEASRILVLAALTLRALSAQIRPEARDLESKRFEAMIHADAPALEGMLSGDLVYTHASGWRQTKAEFLASVRSGELVYHSFAAHDVKSRTYGNTIVATGRATAKVRAKGQELDVDLFFLEIYARQDGRWQLVAWQSTRVVP